MALNHQSRAIEKIIKLLNDNLQLLKLNFAHDSFMAEIPSLKALNYFMKNYQRCAVLVNASNHNTGSALLYALEELNGTRRDYDINFSASATTLPEDQKNETIGAFKAVMDSLNLGMRQQNQRQSEAIQNILGDIAHTPSINNFLLADYLRIPTHLVFAQLLMNRMHMLLTVPREDDTTTGLERDLHTMKLLVRIAIVAHVKNLINILQCSSSEIRYALANYLRDNVFKQLKKDLEEKITSPELGELATECLEVLTQGIREIELSLITTYTPPFGGAVFYSLGRDIFKLHVHPVGLVIRELAANAGNDEEQAQRHLAELLAQNKFTAVDIIDLLEHSNLDDRILILNVLANRDYSCIFRTDPTVAQQLQQIYQETYQQLHPTGVGALAFSCLSYALDAVRQNPWSVATVAVCGAITYLSENSWIDTLTMGVSTVVSLSKLSQFFSLPATPELTIFSDESADTAPSAGGHF